MCDPASSRGGVSSSWLTHDAESHARMQATGPDPSTSLSQDSDYSHPYRSAQANGASPPAWSAAPTAMSSHANGHHAQLPETALETHKLRTELGTTALESNPATRSAGSATRTRIFDPARDLNPTQPPNVVNHSPSPCLSSSNSENSRGSFPQIDQAQYLQHTTPYLSSSSTVPATSCRPDSISQYHTRYQLEVAEHPVCARASTYGDRDRRLISPPPILRLSLRNYNPDDPDDLRQLTWAYNIVHCTLWRTPHVDSPSSEWTEVTEFMGRDGKPQLGLMGTLVANPFVIDAPGSDCDQKPTRAPECFYVFSDLSCRMTGSYRLRFGLTKIGDDFYKQVGARSPTIAYTWTDPFEVYSAKDFPGMRPSSQLLRYLKGKGAYVTIKKEKEGSASAPAKKRARAPTANESISAVVQSTDAKRSKAVTYYPDGTRGPTNIDSHDQPGPDD